MLISVIITTRNRAPLLREAIESVFHQESCGANTGMIVVDDDSTDETPAVVAAFPLAQYVRTKQWTCGGSRNVGIAQARGEWIAFLDDDDVWLPEKLKWSVAAIEQNPDAEMIFSAAQVCDYRLNPLFVWLGPDLKTHRNAYQAFLDELPSPSTVLVRRSVFETVGLFDTSVPRAEDRDLWFRMLSCGIRCSKIAEPLILFRLRQFESGKVAYNSYRDTMTVLHRQFAHDTLGLSWKKRQQVLWRTRRFYARRLIQAAQATQHKGKTTLSRHLNRWLLRMTFPNTLIGLSHHSQLVFTVGRHCHL